MNSENENQKTGNNKSRFQRPRGDHPKVITSVAELHGDSNSISAILPEPNKADSSSSEDQISEQGEFRKSDEL